MRRSKLLLAVAAAAAAVACASASAHGRVGVAIGVGGPWYYPAPYYWGPPTVIVAPPPQAPDYIEQGQPQPGDAPESYSQQQAPAGAAPGEAANGDTWYYCEASKTYYPYVKECPAGWRAVPAQQAPEDSNP